jgi:hypothetical protein
MSLEFDPVPRRHDPRQGAARRSLTRLADRVVRVGRVPLLEAARSGEADALEALVARGADLDACDWLGRRALHHAILGERPENAACLLAHGHDPHAVDALGRAALGRAYASLPLLHRVRQAYRRFRPSNADRPAEGSEVGAALAKELELRGIVRVSGLVTDDSLGRMRAACDAFVARIDRARAAGRGVKRHYDEEEHWWPDDRAYVTNNAFRGTPDLVALAGHPLLREVAIRHLGDPVFVQRGVGMRYLPGRCSEREMFRWHHDMEEQRLKVMVLLGDVGASDQVMSYACGTHVLMHPYEMFFDNPCPLAYCREALGRELEIVQATGRAGDLILFDSNGAHRGHRRDDAPVRDAFFIEYTSDPSDLWGGDLPSEPLAADPATAALFAPWHGRPQAWERPYTRTVPTWVENLPHPERWLRRGRPGELRIHCR